MKKIFLISACSLFLIGAGCRENLPQTNTESISSTNVNNTIARSPFLYKKSSLSRDKWKEYYNKKYRYRYFYPQDVTRPAEESKEGESGSYLLTDPRQWYGSYKTSLLAEPSAYDFGVFNIEILNSKSDQWPGFSLDLKKFVYSLRDYNLRSSPSTSLKQSLSEISTTTFSGRLAYKFDISDGLLNRAGGWSLPERFTFIFVDYNGSRYMISYPLGYGTAEQIKDSFKFPKI